MGVPEGVVVSGCRRYGTPPFAVAVVHGGPGAAGMMAPVAGRLSRVRGILEPLQGARTIDGQVAELAGQLRQAGKPPVILLGHSWGAWLCLVTAARHPELVERLILVGSGPFTEHDAAQIMATRLGRLDEQDQRRAYQLLQAMPEAGSHDRDRLFAAFGELMAKADTVDPLPSRDEAPLPFDAAIFHAIWPEAQALRRSGRLLALAGQVRCPVLAIHGADDPHPFAGVERPLAACLPAARFVLLPDCGHEPWRERRAAETFYRLVEAAIALPGTAEGTNHG